MSNAYYSNTWEMSSGIFITEIMNLQSKYWTVLLLLLQERSDSQCCMQAYQSTWYFILYIFKAFVSPFTSFTSHNLHITYATYMCLGKKCSQHLLVKQEKSRTREKLICQSYNWELAMNTSKAGLYSAQMIWSCLHSSRTAIARLTNTITTKQI